MKETIIEKGGDWGVLITARLKSTRLPQKVLKPLKGVALLGHLVERMKHVNGAESVAIITSPVDQDDPLEAFAESNGIKCFRGHPDDVMQRMYDAATHYNWNRFISCTADNPFVDPFYARKLMRFHEQNGYSMSRIDGLPFGVFSYALSTEALGQAIADKDAVDTEVWGAYFTKNPRLKCGVFKDVRPEHNHPDIRLTVDEPSDFKMVDEILSRCSSPCPELGEILAVIEKHPELLSINQNVQQKAAPDARFKG